MMKIFRYCIYIMLGLLVNSCGENKLSEIYSVDQIKNLKRNDLESCFKSSLLIFDLERNVIKMPGFEIPMDKGRFIFENNEIHILSMEECYFEGEYSVEFYEKNRIRYVLLKNDRVEILCREIDLRYSGIHESLYKRLLDTLSWNSTYCIGFREELCQ